MFRTERRPLPEARTDEGGLARPPWDRCPFCGNKYGSDSRPRYVAMDGRELLVWLCSRCGAEPVSKALVAVFTAEG
jgi:hypothetical protein